MHSLEHINAINRESQSAPHPLYWNPRIVALRESVNQLPVQDEYRQRLRAALYRYADQIVARPYPSGQSDGWDDLEALQQLALSGWLEESIMSSIRGGL